MDYLTDLPTKILVIIYNILQTICPLSALNLSYTCRMLRNIGKGTFPVPDNIYQLVQCINNKQYISMPHNIPKYISSHIISHAIIQCDDINMLSWALNMKIDLRSLYFNCLLQGREKARQFLQKTVNTNNILADLGIHMDDQNITVVSVNQDFAEFINLYCLFSLIRKTSDTTIVVSSNPFHPQRQKILYDICARITKRVVFIEEEENNYNGCMMQLTGGDRFFKGYGPVPKSEPIKNIILLIVLLIQAAIHSKNSIMKFYHAHINMGKTIIDILLCYNISFLKQLIEQAYITNYKYLCKQFIKAGHYELIQFLIDNGIIRDNYMSILPYIISSKDYKLIRLIRKIQPIDISSEVEKSENDRLKSIFYKNRQEEREDRVIRDAIVAAILKCLNNGEKEWLIAIEGILPPFYLIMDIVMIEGTTWDECLALFYYKLLHLRRGGMRMGRKTCEQFLILKKSMG